MNRTEAFIEFSKLALVAATDAHNHAIRAEYAAHIASGTTRPFRATVDNAVLVATYEDTLKAIIASAKEFDALP